MQLRTGKENFEKTVVLTIGRTAGTAFAFFIPVFLSRWLTIENYGTFRLIFLIHLFTQTALNLGVDYGLFYFVKKDPDRFPIYSLNALFVNIIFSLIVAISILIFSSQISSLLNNQSIETYLPLTSLMIFLSLPTEHFQHYLIILNRIKSAFLLDVIYEVSKAAAVICGFYFFNSLYVVLSCLCVIFFLKLLVLLFFNLSSAIKIGLTFKDCSNYLIKQLAFGIPIGFANLIVFTLKLDRFVVSAMFSVRQFTIYTVGCFNIPLIPTIAVTMLDLMSFEMIEARKTNNFAKIGELWRSTMRKIFLVQFPTGIFLLFFAHIFITLIFSNTYAESVIYFQIFMVSFLFFAEQSDIVYRVFAQTNLNLRIQFLAAAYTISLVIGFAWYFGPLGALIAKLFSDLITLVIKLYFAGKLMNLNLKNIFNWKDLFGIISICIICVVPVYYLISNVPFHQFFKLFIGFIIFGLSVFALSRFFRLIKDDEWHYLFSRLRSFCS